MKKIIQSIIVLAVIAMMALILWPHKLIPKLNDDAKEAYEMIVMSQVKSNIDMILYACNTGQTPELSFKSTPLHLTCDNVFKKISISNKDDIVRTNIANGINTNEYPLGVLMEGEIEQAKELWITQVFKDGRILIKGPASSTVEKGSSWKINKTNYWLFNTKDGNLSFVGNDGEVSWPK